VLESMKIAKRIVSELFEALSKNPELLPADWKTACAEWGGAKAARVARDYIAGMTDRFAILEHERIFGTELELRSDQA
jgi:dGTPase